MNDPGLVPRFPHCHCLQWGTCLHPSGVDCTDFRILEYVRPEDMVKLLGDHLSAELDREDARRRQEHDEIKQRFNRALGIDD